MDNKTYMTHDVYLTVTTLELNPLIGGVRLALKEVYLYTHLEGGDVLQDITEIRLSPWIPTNVSL